MKHYLFTLLFICCLYTTSYAQLDVVEDHVKESTKLMKEISEDSSKVKETPWSIKGNTGINFSQASFVNWVAGGDNSFTGTAYFNVRASYIQGRSAWNTDLSLEYGGLWLIDNNEYRKNSDKIDFATKYGYAMNKTLFASGLFDFKTQFSEGYDYKTSPATITSRFVAPAYSKLSIGLDYKPTKVFSLFMSPITGKMTFVSDNSLAIKYGMVDENNVILNPFWFKIEPGAFLKADVNWDIASNINLNTKADFFTAYDNSFGDIDINWDLVVSMKVNQFIRTSISTSLKYDKDILIEGTPKVQFREIIALGIGYSF